MRRTTRKAFNALLLCAALVAVAPPLDAQPNQPQPSVQPAPVKRTLLQRMDVPGTNLEVIYATVEIAPGFRAGRHNHPGTVMAQVTDGEFWFHLDGEPERVLQPGETLKIADRAIHNEGATDKGVKLTAVYVVEKGKPLAAPAP